MGRRRNWRTSDRPLADEGAGRWLLIGVAVVLSSNRK
jgi:hypothetical protein